MNRDRAWIKGYRRLPATHPRQEWFAITSSSHQTRPCGAILCGSRPEEPGGNREVSPLHLRTVSIPHGALRAQSRRGWSGLPRAHGPGQLAGMTLAHLAIASKTGLLAVSPALGVTFTRYAKHLANRWTISLFFGICTFCRRARPPVALSRRLYRKSQRHRRLPISIALSFTPLGKRIDALAETFLLPDVAPQSAPSAQRDRRFAVKSQMPTDHLNEPLPASCQCQDAFDLLERPALRFGHPVVAEDPRRDCQ